MFAPMGNPPKAFGALGIPDIIGVRGIFRFGGGPDASGGPGLRRDA